MKAKTKAKKVEHYLISIKGRGGHMHCFVISRLKAHENENLVRMCASRMMDLFEKEGIDYLPMVLASVLTKTETLKAVREIVFRKYDTPEEQAQLQDEGVPSGQFRQAIWGTPSHSPDDALLTKMH